MKNKAWLFGGAAALALLAGGYALAQSHGRGLEGMRGMDMQGMHQQSGEGNSDRRMGGRGGDERQGRMGREGRGEHARGEQGRGGEGRQSGMNHEGHGEQGRGEGGMQGHGQHMQGMGRQGRGEGRMNGLNHEGGDRSRGNTGEDHARMGGHGDGGPIDATRLDTLKTQIGVKAEQESAWTKYTTAVKEASDVFKTSHDKIDMQAVRQMPQADRQAFMTSQRNQAREQFDKVSAAAKEFAATLDATQKAKAGNLPGLGGEGRGPRTL